jgi:DNA-binding transcriptional ArsR family regulator
MGSTKGTVSQTLNALEDKGLIERCRKLEDRRSVNITLTASGGSLLEQDPLSEIHAALESCPLSEQLRLVESIERLLGIVLDHQKIPEFGKCLDCSHYRPEACVETNSVGCRCGISGELFSSLELENICADFARII